MDKLIFRKYCFPFIKRWKRKWRGGGRRRSEEPLGKEEEEKNLLSLYLNLSYITLRFLWKKNIDLLIFFQLGKEQMNKGTVLI